jgi:hypothetical protein
MSPVWSHPAVNCRCRRPGGSHLRDRNWTPGSGVCRPPTRLRRRETRRSSQSRPGPVCTGTPRRGRVSLAAQQYRFRSRGIRTWQSAKSDARPTTSRRCFGTRAHLYCPELRFRPNRSPALRWPQLPALQPPRLPGPGLGPRTARHCHDGHCHHRHFHHGTTCLHHGTAVKAVKVDKKGRRSQRAKQVVDTLLAAGVLP